MNQINIIFKAGVEYQEKIYASAKDINGLFQLDLKTNEVRYLKRFSEENNGGSLHQMAFLHNNEAWFIPRMGKYIAIVNLDSMDIKYLRPIYRKVINKVDYAMYYFGMIIETNYLCLIPMKVDTLLLINMDTKDMYPYEGLLEEGECFPFGAYAEGCVFLYPYIGEKFLEFNLRTKEKRRYLWKHPLGAYEEVLYCNNKIWFTPLLSDYILKMNIKTKEFMKISIGYLYEEGCMYHQIVVYNNALFFIPFESDRILRFDLFNNKLSKICLPGKNRYRLLKIYSLKLLVLTSDRENLLFVYDDESKSLKKIEINITQKDLINEIEKDCGSNLNIFIQEGFFAQKGVYKEGYLGLKKYIEVIYRHKRPVNTAEISKKIISDNRTWNEKLKSVLEKN